MDEHICQSKGPLWFWDVPEMATHYASWPERWKWEPDPTRLGAYRPITLRHPSGQPLRGGDMEPDSIVTYDVATGIVLGIEPPGWRRR